MGQTADLFDLQRILLRSKSKLSNVQQQNITRWAVWRAAALLKKYRCGAWLCFNVSARQAAVVEHL
jgi:hypothetical protein